MTRAEQLVAGVRAKGSDARDPRDAAHEACHAIEWKVKRKWTRDNIHAGRPKLRNRAFGVRDEITARAVEALVCAELGIEYDLEKWAMTCWMEMLKNEQISLPAGDFLPNAIKARMGTTHAKNLMHEILDTFAPTE